MNLSEEQSHNLKDFFYKSDFADKGGVITDLDGTAIHEYQGKYTVPYTGELGLKKVHDLGRPVVIFAFVGCSSPTNLQKRPFRIFFKIKRWR